MQDLIHYLCLAACVVVLAGSVCRIGLMNARRNRFAWFVVYVASAVFSAGVALDLLLGHRVDWYSLVGVAGLLLYLMLTRKQWAKGPPPEVCSKRGELRTSDGREA